ncbi:hypothetical protein A2331_02110 [Candidatus Falkowbacteria bacterium RIFOXYB2_FULL_34_18]|uniref:Uncharacterized protein n=1 Tax=Candidatus Falkowbacteria bacterium RIFOXYD2_FULL_34_120 TaxID=1798007 RepID=A0A1F5TQU9_9BACT|nr:MAG: hypothetical protein A2331_02110 [Candidatus Falkowbacteria bacterium RIFOXYB2_FULL_34_18]OGF29537.1 MAG: hypothetical protein A2500_02420 [Candidatus Falkowbacteria bacterium RIFOXYC12_FULL_34_55]OGF36853.1 MAG: hypothetical protein A2466_06550 [Candidatus Falkowbacteria bacterium RIFOXYC2_FULL_34_220]OGF39052.1 MAG: hypothetical protein A2515_04555 [Candidatus Falkowbacteria bacterium RIFOXYD12_FULL_34_57]OGF41295.1 MAG: hypothetical protein A2531_00335 [Candidatus Falkowbacteria bact
MENRIQEKFDLIFNEFRKKIAKIKSDFGKHSQNCSVIEEYDFEQALETLKRDCSSLLDEVKPEIQIPKELLIIGDVKQSGIKILIMGDVHHGSLVLPQSLYPEDQQILEHLEHDKFQEIITQLPLVFHEEIPLRILPDDYFQKIEWRTKIKPDNYQATLKRHKKFPPVFYNSRRFLQNRG